MYILWLSCTLAFYSPFSSWSCSWQHPTPSNISTYSAGNRGQKALGFSLKPLHYQEGMWLTWLGLLVRVGCMFLPLFVLALSQVIPVVKQTPAQCATQPPLPTQLPLLYVIRKTPRERCSRRPWSPLWGISLGGRTHSYSPMVLQIPVRITLASQLLQCICCSMHAVGKTYTITGTPTEPGILPRSLDLIFNSHRSAAADLTTAP